MSAKRKRLLAIAKVHRKAGADFGLPHGVLQLLRPKRRPGRPLWSLQMKLYIPLPGDLKCECMRLARENRLSQAELGLLIVAAAVEDKTWLRRVLKARKQT